MASSVKYTAAATDPKVSIKSGKGPTKNKAIHLYERAAGNLFNQHFDSKVLEDFYLECAYPLSQRRFMFATLYLIVISIAWLILFVFKEQFLGYVVGAGFTVLIAAVACGLSFTNIFAKFYLWISLGLSILLSIIVLLSLAVSPPSVSVVFNLGIVVQLIIIMYALFPIRLWMAFSVGAVVSVLYELIVVLHYQLYNIRFVVITIILLIGVQLVGFIIHIMSQVRRRTTFLKLCQSASISKAIKIEQKAKNDMIRSLMPDEVALEVMKEADSRDPGGHDDDDDNDETQQIVSGQAETSEHDDSELGIDTGGGAAVTNQVTFRKLHVSQLENVSILFADIVGFTKMSSNKSAPQLVHLLNDLFGRFDTLCEMTKCEKIATLGDCYYCVSGCPNPVGDHAERCVEMGRAMCKAIQQFDMDHHEEVNMRVGVHTGMVICGIVGTRRFKFDVWSNDVTLANEMESSGEPGQVHISDSTYSFVKELYDVREGEPVPDIRKFKVLIEYFDEKLKSYAIKHKQEKAMIATYFIVERKDKGPVVELPKITITPWVEESEREAMNSNPVNAHNQANDTVNLDPHDKNDDSDFQLVQDIKAETRAEKVFYSPPINPCTLNFTDAKIETIYRNQILHRPKNRRQALTWATPRVTPMVDLLANALFCILIIIACFVGFYFGDAVRMPSNAWIYYIVIALSLLLLLLYLVPLIVDIATWTNGSKSFLSFYRCLFMWYPLNIVGAIVLFLPTVLVLCNFRSCHFIGYQYEYRTFTGVLHLFMVCNYFLFTIFSSFAKSGMATLAVILSLILFWVYRGVGINWAASCPNNNSTMVGISQVYNSTYDFRNASNIPPWGYGVVDMEIEMTITLLLTLILIWFLNREYDISFRLSFNCDHQATVEKNQIAREKRQADWLLENIIPKYIIEDVKATKKYSRHVQDAGVIFATIANFAEFYDEQFEGGKEMLRVLNEMYADCENLLSNPKYKDVEKIKTIGACFMAASGLNEIERAKNKRPDSHLYALMDFCIDLLDTIDQFNAQIFNFDFELKIGYNFGDVITGVIGTTKLLYDIWGDTVNVASRMYSTGSKRRIQVPKQVANRLSDRYEFEKRGTVAVKGKGDMETYLLVKKIDRSAN